MRRCPLFLRLTKPFPHLTVKPVQFFTTDDEDEYDTSEVDIFLVSRNCQQMRNWAKQLKARHSLDQTHKTEDGLSSLSLKPMNQAELRSIGKWTRALYGVHGDEVISTRGDRSVYARTTYVCVAVQRASNEAVGFVSFSVMWHAYSIRAHQPELEIEPDQVWMDPAFRLKRRGELLSWAVASAVLRHLREIERTVQWREKVIPELYIGADIYSKSGERFLDLCADAIDHEITWSLDADKLAFDDMRVHARW